MNAAQSEREMLIIKVGTTTLTTVDSQSAVPTLHMSAFRSIGNQLQALHRQYDIVLVSSGAITAGMAACGIQNRPSAKDDIAELQRLASLGTSSLLHAWQSAMPSIRTGCLLLTRHSLHKIGDERSKAISTILQHCKHRDIPIVNENDAIAVDEIVYGDNDTLAAEIAVQLKTAGHAARLVLLSNVDGVYATPADSSTLIPRIENVDSYWQSAGESDSQHGTGGMRTKFSAARMATHAGVDMYIANGAKPNSIAQALAGKAGTHFVAHTKTT